MKQRHNDRGAAATDLRSAAAEKMERKEHHYTMNRNRVTKRDVAWFVAALLLLLAIVAWAGEAHAQTMPPACPTDANGIVLCHAVWLPLVQSGFEVTGDTR